MNTIYKRSKKRVLGSILLIFLLLLHVLILEGCKKDDGPDPDNSEDELMNQVIGTYLVEGLYDVDLMDERELSITRKANNELEISGNGFPAFKIMKFFIGYQNAKDKDEYIIFSETVAPHDGTVTFSFPKKEILIGVTIKIDATTKKNLALTGTKK